MVSLVIGYFSRHMADFETSTAASSRAAITPARLAAAAVLRELRGGMLLDGAFDAAGATLDARDRRWIRELVYVTLRRRAWIDAVLDTRVRGGLSRLQPDVRDLVRLGLTQLIFMTSVPAYAAIAQTVEQAKAFGIGTSKLVNAVLRRVDRERDSLEPATPADPLDALALATSHPRWLVARWVARWGADSARRLLEANNTEAHTILRPVGLV
ncbi:MAG TPA: transcription antitermination factor NusB, partial [Gemmatimonadaceae bacterium]|nr:transcription antitermination factor NusB [Gemmatimonadaceae bacterium]